MGNAMERICLFVTCTFKSFIGAALSISLQKYLILLLQTYTLNATFKIQTTDVVTADARLFIQISQQGITYWVIDNGNECVALHTYHFAVETNFEKAATNLKQLAVEEKMLQENFKKVTIIYAYPTVLLVPSEFLLEAAKKDMLELVHGDITDVFIRTDFLYRHHMHNIYTVPKQLDAVVSYLFSSQVSTHQYSLLPDMFMDDGNHLHCIFGNHYFTVMLVKEGKLQAIQTFQFKTPEDVAYYLLQLCESFEVDVNDITLHLNGMIDSSSNLFTELNKYFLQLQFAALPGNFTYPEEIGKYPAHYFSHLFAAATCV